MAITHTRAAKIRAITSCVPSKRFDNLKDTSEFTKEEIQKVVRMAGVKTRHMADDSICSSDLCLAAAKDVMQSLDWSPDSIDALIFITQSQDYFLPSTACLIHRDLGLSLACASFDVGHQRNRRIGALAGH
jgi:3-oxoacyl-[acyl-carrier-protein] synthase-3